MTQRQYTYGLLCLFLLGFTSAAYAILSSEEPSRLIPTDPDYAAASAAFARAAWQGVLDTLPVWWHVGPGMMTPTTSWAMSTANSATIVRLCHTTTRRSTSIRITVVPSNTSVRRMWSWAAWHRHVRRLPAWKRPANGLRTKAPAAAGKHGVKNGRSYTRPLPPITDRLGLIAQRSRGKDCQA